MKYILYSLLFLVLTNCEKEKGEIKKGRVEINEKYIKYSFDQFKINRNYIIESIDDSQIYSYKRLIDSNFKLPYGNYKLIYSSFYKQDNKIKFTVNSKTTVVNYYSDSLDYSYIKDTKCCLLVDQLKEGEILAFYNKHSGCFHNYTSEMKITKRGSDYYINTNHYKNKKLSTKQIRLLREFEFEIRNLDLREYYCTSNEKYLFLNLSTKEFVSTINGSCWYYGSSYFMESLEE